MKRIPIVLLCVLMLLATCAVCASAQEPVDDSPEAPAEEAPAATAPDEESQPSQPAVPPVEYKIHTEDVMRVVVWNEEKLSTEQMVDPLGYVTLPLLGQVKVKGLTIPEVADTLTELLSKYLVEPKVQITMVKFQKPTVHIVGQVNRPGLHEIKYGDRVMEAIAQAGSFTDAAYLEGATLTHQGPDESTPSESIPLDLHKLFYEGDMSKNVVIEDGDTLYIPEDVKNKYFVLGEVYRPGTYRLKDGMTVMEAISTAGGPKERANLKSTCIIRGEDVKAEVESTKAAEKVDGPGETPDKADTEVAAEVAKDDQPKTKIKVDVSKLIKEADLAQNLELEPGDVVYVPESSKPDWPKIAQIISSIVNTSYMLRMWGF